MFATSSRGANATPLAADLSSNRARRLGLALLLLGVPACGLSEYEALMHETQVREERFNEEQKYLGEMVLIPTKKGKDEQIKALADVFFRAPKGIEPKPQQRTDLLWRYLPGNQGSDFIAVDLAFADDDKNFANKVVDSYGSSAAPVQSTRQVTLPGQLLTLNFDVWQFNNGQTGYSINVLKGGQKPLGIVFMYKRARYETAQKAIELSLQLVAVDQHIIPARQRYQRKSPWNLEKAAGT